jgi:GNAT superfamily N-acetyltransferase
MMPDLIVPLYDLPDNVKLLKSLQKKGIVIRHAKPWELDAVAEFINIHFDKGWVSETSVGFSSKPISVLIALDGNQIVGFGVDEAYRGKGIGKALLIESLAGLRSMGYVYGFIGSPGPVDFYLKAVKGMLLPGDYTSIYQYKKAVTNF